MTARRVSSGRVKTRRDGLTIVEVLFALIILAVGLLAMLTTTAYATRSAVLGRNADLASTFAASRIERLRLTACTTMTAGADTLVRGGAPVAWNAWTITPVGTSMVRVVVTTTYVAGLGARHQHQLEEGIACTP